VNPEHVAVRAYFRCEERIRLDLPGDTLSDWLIAEILQAHAEEREQLLIQIESMGLDRDYRRRPRHHGR
jgi:hypothetical protein